MPTLALSRRTLIAAAGAALATPALAEECRLGPAPHTKGPAVFLNYDQEELDAAYDQSFYAPLAKQIIDRYASRSVEARARLGAPIRKQYGPTSVEGLDIYRARQANAPVFVFIHGGAWRGGEAKNYAFAAELFARAGVHYVVLDFNNVLETKGNLGAMVDQVRRAVAWVYKNAKSFGGDPKRLYVGGHSSGGHLAGCVVTTDWQKDHGLPPDILKGGLCMSGMYELKPVALSKRGQYVKFDEATLAAYSSQRHLDLVRAPLTITYGGNETPEFQRQNRDFFAALKAAGKKAELVAAPDYNHFEMCESLGDPYRPNGRAALAMIHGQRV